MMSPQLAAPLRAFGHMHSDDFPINYDNAGVIERALQHLAQNSYDIAFIGVDPRDKTTGKAAAQRLSHWCTEHEIVARITKPDNCITKVLICW